MSTIGITSSGNTASVNGKSATIVNDVSGQMVDGNTLEIEVNGVAGQVALPSQSREITGSSIVSAQGFYDDIKALLVNQTMSGSLHFYDPSEGGVYYSVSFTIGKASNGTLYPSGFVFKYMSNEQRTISSVLLSGGGVVTLRCHIYDGSNWTTDNISIDSTCTVNGRYFIS